MNGVIKKSAREKIIQKIVYKKNALWIEPKDFEVEADAIAGLSAGIVERDGKQYEFETLTFYYGIPPLARDGE